jgi:electron transfer flavoprotein alpha subunit
MRIAVLVKQIPRFEEMELGADGRLRRDGIDLELNPYCRRAVSQGVELASARAGSRVTVITLGPPAAEDALREAIAWGTARAVDTDGVLVTDPAFAGSDTLATARALAAALEHEGPFDLVLTGRNSVDADTGQVGPEVAELCDLPFLSGVRHLSIDETLVSARCEHDDGWLQAEVHLPAILSCAERLIEPAKVDPPERATVSADRIRRLSAADLGPGPWGQAASPTTVGSVKVMAVTRARHRKPEAPLEEQAREAVRLLHERGAFQPAADPAGANATDSVAPPRPDQACTIVVAEPDRPHDTRELLGAAAALTGNVLVVTRETPDAGSLRSWGADAVVHLDGDNIEEDVARAVAQRALQVQPWAILTGSTAWGREVASRVAAQLGAGLTGDAVELERVDDGLVAWKPAFGGQLVAAIHCASPVQMATVRAGVLPTLSPREPGDDANDKTPPVEPLPLATRARVRVLARTRDDDLDVLAEAHTVIGVGMGVPPDAYDDLEPLRTLLGAQLGATRKVTDQGWLPRSRQIGITGRSIAPRLFVSIGASGKFNHTVGLRAAGTVLAINADASAPIFDAADAGIVGNWRAVVPLLVEQLRAARA